MRKFHIGCTFKKLEVTILSLRDDCIGASIKPAQILANVVMLFSFLVKQNFIKENNKTTERKKNPKKAISHPYWIRAKVEKNRPKKNNATCQ